MNVSIQDQVNRLSIAFEHFVRNLTPVQQQSSGSTRHVHFSTPTHSVLHPPNSPPDLTSNNRQYSGYYNSAENPPTPQQAPKTTHPLPDPQMSLPHVSQLQQSAAQHTTAHTQGASVKAGLCQGLLLVLGSSYTAKHHVSAFHSPFSTKSQASIGQNTAVTNSNGNTTHTVEILTSHIM